VISALAVWVNPAGGMPGVDDLGPEPSPVGDSVAVVAGPGADLGGGQAWRSGSMVEVGEFGADPGHRGVLAIGPAVLYHQRGAGQRDQVGQRVTRSYPGVGRRAHVFMDQPLPTYRP
jgi:hypothetical protein